MTKIFLGLTVLTTFTVFVAMERLTQGVQDMNVNNKVEINIPSPFNLSFTLDMYYSLDQYETKIASKPWVPVCQKNLCKIYVGDRNQILPGYPPNMFPRFVTVSLLDENLFKNQQKLTSLIRSLDPGFFNRKEVVKRAVSDKINTMGVPLKLIDCRLEGGDPMRFESYVIVRANPPILISNNGEVVIDSIRIESR